MTVPALAVIAGRSIIRDLARAPLLPGGQVELWPDASRVLTGEYPERIAERVATSSPCCPAIRPRRKDSRRCRAADVSAPEFHYSESSSLRSRRSRVVGVASR